MRNVVVAIAVLVSSTAVAGPTREQMTQLSAFGMQLICLQQGPTHRTTPLARMLEERPGFSGWQAIDESPRAQCLQKHQWISEALCNDLMSLNLEDMSALRDVLQRHEGDLAAADAGLDYVSKTQNASFHGEPEPPCPTQRLAPAAPAPPAARIPEAEPRQLFDPEDMKAARKESDEMHARWDEGERAQEAYLGHLGKDARQQLQDQGFECSLIVQNGLRRDSETGMPVRAELPSYRCIKHKDIAPVCACLIVRLQLPPQSGSKTSVEYQDIIDAMTLGKENVDAECVTPPGSMCWKAQ